MGDQGQLDRMVSTGHNPHHPVRIIICPSSAGHLGKGGTYAFRMHPAFQVFLGTGKASASDPRFTHEGLIRGFIRSDFSA